MMTEKEAPSVDSRSVTIDEKFVVHLVGFQRELIILNSNTSLEKKTSRSIQNEKISGEEIEAARTDEQTDEVDQSRYLTGWKLFLVFL